MLTIIIPSIGRVTTERAINSIKKQTIPTKYILALDDKRKGAGPTRNEAIKYVDTEWVGFCDDDDWLDRHYHEWLKEECDGYDMIIFQMKQPWGMIVPTVSDPQDIIFNWVGISFALKTKLAKKYPFKNMIGEDYDLIDRIRKNHKVKIVHKVAYFIG